MFNYLYHLVIFSFLLSLILDNLKCVLQIFVLVVGYGLFHGLVFLPVILSLIGPEPYQDEVKNEVVRSRANSGNEVKESEVSLILFQKKQKTFLK